jgi:4'-phosphopantetheinyl transferase
MKVEWLDPGRLDRFDAIPEGDAPWCFVLLADTRDPRIASLLTPAPSVSDYKDRDRPATSDRACFLARRALQRSLIARLTGCRPDSVLIRYNEQGAPQVEIPEGLFVSVAGHGPWAMLAIANRPAGVDFEPVLTDVEPVKDVLHTDEVFALDGLPESERAAFFLRIWTAKEAYLKALGRGFLDDPLQLCMRFSGNAIHVQSNGVLQARAAGESRETAIDATPVVAACFLLDEVT